MLTTHYCPECALPIPVRNDSIAVRACPACGATLPSEAKDDWTNVARVTSLAEAGFLADELAGAGLEVRIYRAEDFSALADRWTAQFFIQAPSRDAHSVAAHIRQHLTDTETRLPLAGAGSWDGLRSPVDLIFWRPVALIVLAGVVSFVVGQRFAAEREAGHQLPRNSLPGAVNAIGRPLVTEPVPGLPRHRLLYNRWQQAWYLDTDADSDGRYETRQRFHAAGAGW
jgi:hypothetical protein